MNYSRRGASLAGAILLLCCILPIETKVATAQTTNKSVDELKQKTQIVTDSRLDKGEDFTVLSTEYSTLLKLISESSKIDFHNKASLNHRRISLFSPKMSYRDMMKSIAYLAKVEWKPSDATSSSVAYGYTLIQSEVAKKVENKLIVASEKREVEALEALQRQLLSEIQGSIQNADADHANFAAYLSSQDSDDMASVMEATQSMDTVISANDQSHYYNRLTNSTPFNELSQSAQQAVSNMLKREAKMGPNGQPLLGPPGKDECQIALIGDDFGLHLAVVNPDGDDLWASPYDQIQLHTESTRNIDDNDPEIRAWFSNEQLVDLRTMPNTLRKKKFRFPKNQSRKYLPQLLQTISEALKITIACDDYLRTRELPFQQILQEDREYTLEEALLQIAKTSSHRMIYHEGVLYAMTLTLGLDLRCEPPDSFWDHCQKRLSLKRTSSFKVEKDDYFEIGKLTPHQLETLTFHLPPNLTPFSIGLFKIAPIHHAMKFYVSLNDEQKAMADSKDGLQFKMMSKSQKEIFKKLTRIGLPQRRGSKEIDPKPGRFYAVNRAGTKSDGITLYSVSEKSATRVKRAELNFN